MLHALARRTAACLWLTVVVALPSTCAHAQTNGERLLQSAHALLERGLDGQAAAEYEDAIERLDDPQQAADARYGLAIALRRLGHPERAIDALVAIPADLAFGYRTDADVLLTTLLAQHGDKREAVRAAERVLDQTDHASWPGMASLHVELLYGLGQHREATSSFRSNRKRLEERSPDAFARAALFAGLAAGARAESSDDQAAAARLLELSASDDSLPEIRDHGLLAAANAWQRAARTDEAERVLRRALTIGAARTATVARLGLGALLRADGRPDEAADILGDMDRSQLDATSRGRADLELGLAQLESDAPRRAARSLDRVLESDETELHAVAAYWRAKADLRRERLDEAATRYEHARTRYPESPLAAETTYDLGVARQRAGQTTEAQRAFEAVRSTWPAHPLAEPAHLAELSLELEHGSSIDAIALAERFLEVYDESDSTQRARLLLGEALFNAGLFTEASEQISPLVESDDPTIADRAALLSGLALHADGHPRDALPVLTRAGEALGDVAAAAPVHLAMAQIYAKQEAWRDARAAAAMFLRVAPNDDPRRPEARLLMGIALARLDARQDAIEAFGPLLSGSSDRDDDVVAQARLELGQLHQANGSIARATTLLKQLVNEQSDSRFAPYAFRLLAAMAAEAGDTDEAESLYARAASGGNEDIAAASRLDHARVLLAAGRDAKAAEVLRDASAGPSLAWRAIALGRAGQHADAIELAGTVDIDSLPRDLAESFLYQLADSERRSGNAARAAELLNPLLASTTLASEAALQLAELAIERGDLPTAVGLLQQGLEQTSESSPDVCASIRYQLAWCHYRLDEPRAVVELLEDSPCDIGTLTAPKALLLGEAYASLERNGDAALQFATALNHNLSMEQYDSVLLRLGETSAAAQDWHTSRRAFARHRDEHGDSPRWFVAEFGIGWALDNLGRHADALEHYRAVIGDHRGETAARAQFQIGECLFALGRLDEAVRELLRVDTMYDEPEWSAAALFEAGRCFEAMNKIGEARAQYRLVLDQHGESPWAEASAERLRTIAAPGGS